MNNTKKLVQNGTFKRLGKKVGIVNAVESTQNQAIGRIRVLEDDNNIVISHVITQREHFVSQYSHFAVKTAQSTVEMCRVVHEAKVNLMKDEFLAFCGDIGHKSEDSTIRKYLAIGSHYERLIQYTTLLPNSWTSIYEITQIPSDAFDALVSTGSSMANLKGAQIKLLKDANKKSDAATTAASTAIDATAATAADSVNSDAAATTADTAAVATPTTASTAATTTTDTTTADLAHAQQATASLLERVAQTANAEANGASDDDLADEPYDVVIHFRSRPSEAATFAMLDAITSVISKHRIDAEITSSRTCEAD